MKTLWNRSASVAVVACSIFASQNLAVAGKPERDMADELQPKINSTQAEVRAACGCDVHTDVAWDTFLKVDGMARIADTLAAFVTAAKAECIKDADKKAFCGNVTGLEVKYGQNVSGVQSDGTKLIATSSETYFTSDNLFTDVISRY